MKKHDNSKKAQRRRLAICRYSAKRRSRKWKYRKRLKILGLAKFRVQRKRQSKRPFKNLEAPKNFSFIDNTEEVLSYFKFAEKHLAKQNNIILDISKVDVLAADTITLMVASIKNPRFHRGSVIKGNAPEKSNLRKLFTESGFYDYVNAEGNFFSGAGNLLHYKVDKQVVPVLARKAFRLGMQHVFGSEVYFDPLYEILIECMSNTNDHADLENQGVCNWWLYVYNDPDQKVTSYSFLDLGVGIFKSAVVKNYLGNLMKNAGIYENNIKIAEELLSGRLQSRIDKDNEIRGKGLPQIVESSKSTYFKKFYIISNNVKIDLKTMEKEKLEHELSGTFLYWELINQ